MLLMSLHSLVFDFYTCWTCSPLPIFSLYLWILKEQLSTWKVSGFVVTFQTFRLVNQWFYNDCGYTIVIIVDSIWKHLLLWIPCLSSVYQCFADILHGQFGPTGLQEPITCMPEQVGHPKKHKICPWRPSIFILVYWLLEYLVCTCYVCRVSQ